MDAVYFYLVQKVSISGTKSTLRAIKGCAKNSKEIRDETEISEV